MIFVLLFVSVVMLLFFYNTSRTIHLLVMKEGVLRVAVTAAAEVWRRIKWRRASGGGCGNVMLNQLSAESQFSASW